MSRVIKTRKVFLVLLFYYLYQTIWLSTLSIVYTSLHEDQSRIWYNFIEAVNPKTVVAYSILLYPISIACLFVLLLTTVILNKYRLPFIRAFLVSFSIVLLFNMLFLVIGVLIGTPLQDLFNWISLNWNESMKTGFYGYVLGSIVFMALYIPSTRILSNYK